MTGELKYWLQMPQGGWVATRQNLRLYVQLAEELGYHGVWVGDHIVIPETYESQYPYGERHPVLSDRPFLEAYTTLSYIAGMTNRIRMNLNVAIGPYRHPLLHAKVAASLDYLSDGRLEIGIGTGWLREEFDALGADYDHRWKVTDEYTEAMIALWSGEPTSYAGKHVSFEAVRCVPKPVQSPHPPLWIGGSSKAAFARMERFGAAWAGPDLAQSRYLEMLKNTQTRFAELSIPFPGAAAKVWIQPTSDLPTDGLCVSCLPPKNFEVFDVLAEAGATDIRIGLGRLRSSERPQHIIALARQLRKHGWL